MAIDDLDIHPLSPERLADFLAFFDGDPFEGHPEWRSCYCQCFLEDHREVDWQARTLDQNRALACQRISAGAMRGLLAYLDGQVVGWCNAAPRTHFHVLDPDPRDDAERVGTILCFLIAPERRGQGVARQLLEAACEGLRAQGLAIVEANPRPEETDAGRNHVGPMSLYLSAGFTVTRPDPDGSVWVEKALQQRSPAPRR